jgi:hypothetical protein
MSTNTPQYLIQPTVSIPAQPVLHAAVGDAQQLHHLIDPLALAQIP